MKPQILAYEILIHDDRETELESFSFYFKNFEHHLEEDATNNGPSINFGAGLNMLMVNWHYFDNIRIYSVCRFDQHIDPFAHKNCIANQKSSFTLGLPNFNVYKNKQFDCSNIRNPQFMMLTENDLFHESPSGLHPELNNMVNFYEFKKLEFLCKVTGYDPANEQFVFKLSVGSMLVLACIGLPLLACLFNSFCYYCLGRKFPYFDSESNLRN